MKIRTSLVTLTSAALAALAIFAPAMRAAAPPPPTLDDILGTLTMRNIGAFRTGAWVTAIAVPEAPVHDHLYTIYAATRSGGLWKTVNGGITWDPVTDSADIAATGAVAIAPSNPNIVWVGTGDQANARSSYSGKGVFKSTDAGKTWQFMGLPDSQHIARIVIDPKNPDLVYVAAMGHLFSKNDERGVFKTVDGGLHWKKVLYLNDGVGAIDLVINRKTPSTLYAAMYDKDRRPWQIVESGPASGIYRSDDSGEKWTKLEGGLPTGKVGRIGLDLYQKNPLILYALIENQNTATGAPDQPGRGGGRGGAATGGQAGGVSATAPLAQGIIGNELYRTDDGGKTWHKTSPTNVAGGKAPYSFNQIKIDPNNDQVVIANSDSMYITRDAGKTWQTGFFRGAFGDYRCMWWDPDDSDRIILGSDGGVQLSNDGGKTTDYAPNLRVGEVYAIGVDMDDPYNVYGGLQDHDSWKGPSNGRTGIITVEDWVTVGPGDGMYNVVDPTDSRWVYNTRELNVMGRLDQKTGVRTDISPGRAGSGDPRLRYNWIAPIALSPHNPQIVYAGAQLLFRSLDRGDHWEKISPDLTTNDPDKIGHNVPFCTITTISESPLKAGTIWVGTDDGKVQLTQNHGGAWTDVTPALVAAGAPVDRWVSRVFASPFDAATAFVSKTGFRNDDVAPYLYRTTDSGRTWTSIAANLPKAPINVVVQDRKNRNLLVVGTDIGVFVSIDAGGSWSRLKANLPTVAVSDLVIHPREGDLVLGTYGRGFWTGDITPLQELTPEVLDQNVHVFDIEPRPRYGFSNQGMNYHLFGDRFVEVPNERDALTINYYLKNADAAGAKVSIADTLGKPVAQLTGPGRAGLNRVDWNMTQTAGLTPPAGPPGRGGGGGRGGQFGTPAPVGDYIVTVDVGGEKVTKVGRIRERIR
ncbi:MAG: WD40/YVTN/BNR-like repeat-containing protein [Vicinamibacterales bacterium]